MKKANLERLEKTIMSEVAKRRQLGEYSTEAGGLLLFGEALMYLYQHIIDNTPDDPEPKAKKREP